MHRTLLICHLLLTALLIAPLPVARAESDGEAESAGAWREVEALRFFVGEEADFSSVVYRHGSFYLVRPGTGDRGYLLSKRDAKVYVTALAALGEAGGAPALDPTDPTGLTEIATYEKADRGRRLVWLEGERSLAVGPKPELIGQVTLEQVLEEKQAYRDKADAYTPDSATVAALRQYAGGVGFVVGFGTWCPVCADWTPRLIKTLEAAGFASEDITFVSTDPEITRPEEPLARYAISGVPTFIVRRNGGEVGRIEQVDLDKNPEDPIESRILRILQGKDSGS